MESFTAQDILNRIMDMFNYGIITGIILGLIMTAVKRRNQKY